MINVCNGQTLRDMFSTATIWLEKCAADINAINVFPVPDGDTGTNMLLTMRSAMEEAAQSLNGDASLVVKAMAHGALMGARGNSGVILSQFWRGLARGLEGNSSVDGRDFANALQESTRAAYEGVVDPVEGTILTVLKDATEAAQKAAAVNPHDLTGVLEVAVEAARDSVARTPELLPVLKEAGVVDAGGEGLYVLLEGALYSLKGEADQLQHRIPSVVDPELAIQPKVMQMPSEVETPYGYCTNFALEGPSLSLSKIRKDLARKGESLVITGSESLVKVHIHSLNPGEILNYVTRLGKLHDISIDNMDDQYMEFLKAQREKLPVADVAIVTVVAGDGFFKLFNSLGNVIVVPGGQTMNPSVRQLLQAVESAPANDVILLPNNKNIVATARQVTPFTSKKVKVVPTRTVPQGIAAFLAFTCDMGMEENAHLMEEAMSAVTTIEITSAVRKTQINGLKIKKGKPIAILNDKDLIASGDKKLDVAREALAKAEADGAEIMTIYCGAKAKTSETESIVKEIRNKYQCEVEVVYGGQPHYDYIISLE